MSAWASLVVSLLLGAVGAGGVVAFFYVGPQRRKYVSEAGSNEATSASTLSGAALAQMNAAIERATRAEAKADAAETVADQAKADLIVEKRTRRRETAELRAEIGVLRTVLARPSVADAVASSGGMPSLAETTYDSGSGDG